MTLGGRLATVVYGPGSCYSIRGVSVSYYERVWAMQLGFALAAMFAAFFGGLAIGYWRWGREESREKKAEVSSIGSFRSSRRVKPDLFSAAEADFREPASPSALGGFSTAPSEIEAGADAAVS